MSEQGITGATPYSVVGIVGATVGIGTYIINDYVITLAPIEGDYGYTMTITRGSETQTVTLYGLSTEQYDAMLGYLQQAQEAAQSATLASQNASGYADAAGISADSASRDKNLCDTYYRGAMAYADQANTARNRAQTYANNAYDFELAAGTAASNAATAQAAAEAAAVNAGNAQTAAEAAQTAAETAETNAQTYAGQASQSATNAGQSATSAAQTLTQVQNEGAAQIAAVDAEGQRVLASIPADYSQMGADVTDLKSHLGNLIYSWTGGKSIKSDGSEYTNANYSYATAKVYPGATISGYTRAGLENTKSIAFYDANGIFISSDYHAGGSSYAWNYTLLVPDNAYIVKISCATSYKSSFTLYIDNAINQIAGNAYEISKLGSEIIGSVSYNNLHDELDLLASVNTLTAHWNCTYVAPTATVNGDNAGVRTPKFISNSTRLTIRVTLTTSTSSIRIALLKYDANNTETKEILFTQSNISSVDELFTIDASEYVSSGTEKFAIWVYSSVGSGAFTFSEFMVYNATDFTSNRLYNQQFVPMMTEIMDELNNVADATHRVYYCGATRQYTKLIDAIAAAEKYMDSVLYVDPGEYDLVTELGQDYFDGITSSSTMKGVVLKNRIHIIFSPNSRVVCHYTGDNQYVNSIFSAFVAGEYGFTLENLTLYASTIRYAIHDERNGGSEICKSVYKNCHVDFDNSQNQHWSTECAIGGGLGANHEVEISGCVFSGQVYWHLSNGQSANHCCGIRIQNNYFEKNTVLLQMSREDATWNTDILISGNSFPTVANADEQGIIKYAMTSGKVNLLEWNNVKRSS